MLKSFSVSNYRGFAQTQAVELAPLTLFFGQNSSGKSTLLRLLPWLSESSMGRPPGPCLDGYVSRDATWDDLVNAANRDSPLNIKLAWEDGATVAWKLRPAAILSTVELAEVRCEHGATTETLSNDGDQVWQGEQGAIDASLEGMIPKGPGVSALFKEIGARLDALEVQWVTGIRAPVGRVVSVGGAHPSQLRSDGHNSARHLYFWDRARDRDDSRNTLDRFFAALGCKVASQDVAQSGGWFRVVVEPLNGSGVPVNIVDTGEGFTQVLPALIALGRAAANTGPRIVAMEQPELHLHTNAQRALAQALGAAVEETDVQVLVETHSEVLLASIQLAVATGQLTKDKVKIYWVSTRPDGSNRAVGVQLDELGRVDGPWPLDAFTDLLQLRTEIHQARQARQ